MFLTIGPFKKNMAVFKELFELHEWIDIFLSDQNVIPLYRKAWSKLQIFWKSTCKLKQYIGPN